MNELVAAANALTARWAATRTGGSEAMAGAGAWPLLAFLASGADGPGRGELSRAIGIDAGRAGEAGRTILAIMRESPAVRAALGLWARESLPLEKAWTDDLPGGVLGTLSGDKAADQRLLDAWAAEHTAGLIPAMPLEVTDDVRLVLATALTVRTQWIQRFFERRGGFEGGPWAGGGATALRRTVTLTGVLSVVRSPAGALTSHRVVGTDGIDVHLLLGEPGRSAGEVLAAGIGALNGDGEAEDLAAGPGVGVEIVTSAYPNDQLDVTVPKFTVAAAHDLLRLPDVFGLDTVTDTSRGHFPGISAEPLAVGQARQDVVARFDAEGFESAAVTAVGAVAAGAFAPAEQYRVKRVTLVFDRPFGFAAVDRGSGLVLTTGWVAQPERRTG
ncbi:serpin family protein [Spirillospora sp. CA-294931]|uniref:serpin family protein n=1 Tax=Spirillospora sp. CA-294931 TaxID=3240042 RepID=UPI003D9113BF